MAKRNNFSRPKAKHRPNQTPNKVNKQQEAVEFEPKKDGFFKKIITKVSDTSIRIKIAVLVGALLAFVGIGLVVNTVNTPFNRDINNAKTNLKNTAKKEQNTLKKSGNKLPSRAVLSDYIADLKDRNGDMTTAEQWDAVAKKFGDNAQMALQEGYIYSEDTSQDNQEILNREYLQLTKPNNTLGIPYKTVTNYLDEGLKATRNPISIMTNNPLIEPTTDGFVKTENGFNIGYPMGVINSDASLGDYLAIIFLEYLNNDRVLREVANDKHNVVFDGQEINKTYANYPELMSMDNITDFSANNFKSIITPLNTNIIGKQANEDLSRNLLSGGLISHMYLLKLPNGIKDNYQDGMFTVSIDGKDFKLVANKDKFTRLSGAKNTVGGALYSIKVKK